MPDNVSFELLKYNDEDVPLIVTDIDLLQKKDDSSAPAAVVSVPDGKFTALKLAFSLPSGAYATMLFRELQKRETGREYQVKMHGVFKKKKDVEEREEDGGGDGKEKGNAAE